VLPPVFTNEEKAREEARKQFGSAALLLGTTDQLNPDYISEISGRVAFRCRHDRAVAVPQTGYLWPELERDQCAERNPPLFVSCLAVAMAFGGSQHGELSYLRATAVIWEQREPELARGTAGPPRGPSPCRRR
jgi:hypothetical protein